MPNTDPEKAKVYNKRYRETHGEQIAACQRRYRQEHREELDTYQKRYNAEHAEERRAYLARYRDDPVNSKRRADYHRLRTHGVTREWYDAKLSEQGGVCAICGADTPRAKRRVHFYVDHDHRTGEPRGLLCCQCNYGLGHFGDDPEVLRRAATYLTEHHDLKRGI